MARGGEVFRNLRNPSVSIDVDSKRVVITFNGEEDEFVVLQMQETVGDDLANRLNNAGIGEKHS